MGSFSVVWCVRHIEGPPWLGFYSVVQYVRHLMGLPQFSCRCWPVGRERLWSWLQPPTRGSVVSPCFHGCLAFFHRHFPPQSPPSHPLYQSLHSQKQPLPWDCSTIPKLQLQLLHLPGDLHPCPG